MDGPLRGGYVAAMRVGRLVSGADRLVGGLLVDVSTSRAAAFVALAVLGLGCTPAAGEPGGGPPGPNVLLISIDTIRADHLSTYGYERETSPSLTALAEAGTRVRAAYAPSATTGPSHASLFTALPPIAHGVRKNGHSLADTELTLAERLSQIGYRTGAVVSSYVLSGRFGYAQGFDHFDDDFSQAGTPVGTTLWEGEAIEERFYGRADDTTDRALSWLAGRGREGRPFFLFVHYYDPHDPYTPPADFPPPFPVSQKEALKLNRTIYLYDVLVAYTDREIGRLLEGLDAARLGDDTLLIVTGDHGEGLMTHGHMFHGVHVYEEAVRVPLVVRWPGRVAAGVEVPGPFALVDLAPAVLELLGDAHAGGLGRPGAASRLLGGEGAAASAAPIHLYRRHYSGEEEVGDGLEARGEKYGVRAGSWKLIEGPAEGTLELFDLASDPAERVNLAASEPERVAELRALIAAWRDRYERAGTQAPELSEGDRERLRAMGYVE